MKKRNWFSKAGSVLAAILMLLAGGRALAGTPDTTEAWCGVHVPTFGGSQLDKLEKQLPTLAALGVNKVIVQVDYHFDFKSHPELRQSPYITKAKAREFTAAARKLGIEVIPELECLGHQSLGGTTLPLLAKYPQFDETPGLYPGNKGIYCRSWCPQSPGLNQIVFSLIDELTDAFQAKAFHVGMDEVLIIADDHCPRCHGEDPAKLFAKTVNDLHDHIVGERKLTMLMWGDRLLDAKTMHYGKYESAMNGTAPAVDSVPRDVIICDWHYREQANYPSIPYLLQKGFRVWPSGFDQLPAAQALSQFSMKERQHDPRLIGYLATTWSWSRKADISKWPPITGVLPEWK